MEWFSTLSLALGTAWTSGINLYATVTVLGLLQKFGATKLPGLVLCDIIQLTRIKILLIFCVAFC